MKRKVLYLIVFGVSVIAAACSPGQIETIIEDQANTISEQIASEAIQLQQEGIGPIEITPPPPGESHSLAPSSAGDGGNINSLGERTTSAASSGEPGMIESKAPGESTLEEAIQPAVSWITHQDQDHSFSIIYPDTYAILPDENPSAEAGPRLIHMIRFLDRQLASGDTADLEIPNFTIQIYDLGNLSLDTFLDEYFELGNREPFSLGGLYGIRVFFDQMIAPSEFYYFADQNHVYKLTPMGEYSQEMLESFKIQ
jgi:hypothetical protein